MKYPSDYLEDLVPVVDRLEDGVLDLLGRARLEASSWKIWEWRDQARRIEALRGKNRALARELRALQEKYRSETGKPPPSQATLTLIWADDDGWSESMRKFQQALDNLSARWRAAVSRRPPDKGGSP